MKIPYRVQLSDIIVLSRATVHDFLDLEAVVDDDVSTDEEGDGSDGASYPTLFFFKLILITFNRVIIQAMVIMVMTRIQMTMTTTSRGIHYRINESL